MINLELCRALSADRERQVERVLHRRRLLDAIAIRPSARPDDASWPGDRDRDQRAGTSGTPALGSAR
jgi:hypothetical protein